jgi:hypothetical protein
VFATGEMANLLQSEGLAGLFGTGLYKTQPLRDLIARHVDGSMLAAIAREHRAGRRLYIVTTNLDAQRTAIWDMGVIAGSGDPGALDLFRNVLTASASIPGVFSPMLIEVEADGRRSAEMHVDGGVTTNVLILPEALLVSGTPVFPPDARPKVYVAQYAACVLPVCQKPELGLQLGFDRFRLSKIRYDRLRSGLYAAIVRLRLSTGAGRNTMAVDADGVQIAVALTAACRTPVANLGIRTRPDSKFGARDGARSRLQPRGTTHPF